MIQIIVDGVKICSEKEDSFITNQSVLGVKQLFSGFIVKKWIEDEESDVDYSQNNRVIVKMSVDWCH